MIVNERFPTVGSLVVDRTGIAGTPGIVVEVRESPCPGMYDAPDEILVVYPNEADSLHWYRADRLKIVEEDQNSPSN